MSELERTAAADEAAEGAATEAADTAATETVDATVTDTPAADAPAGEEAPAEEKAKKEPKKTEKKLKAELAAANEEKARLETALAQEKDKFLRLAAEYDNFRRRSAKEKDAIYGDATASTVKDVLPLLDNLTRAGRFVGEPEKVAEGLAMIAKMAEGVLGKLGIEAFGAVGESFDPNLHEAVMHVEDEALGEGVIAEVFEVGYKRGDRIIRPAIVKVAN